MHQPKNNHKENYDVVVNENVTILEVSETKVTVPQNLYESENVNKIKFIYHMFFLLDH